MGEQDYTAIYPTASAAVDERVKAFIAAFYAVSDNPRKNQEWLDYFAPDACIVMGNRRAQGVEEIRELREGMWDNVKSRTHKLDKVFPAVFEQPDHERRFEYMLYGVVDLELKSGEKTRGHWAGRAVLRHDEGRGELRYTFYQVYIHI